MPLPIDSRAIIELWWAVACRGNSVALITLTALAAMPAIDSVNGELVVQCRYRDLQAVTGIHFTEMTSAVEMLETAGVITQLPGRQRGGMRYVLHRSLAERAATV